MSKDVKPLEAWLSCDMSLASVTPLVGHPAFKAAARALNKVKVAAALHPDMSLVSKDAGHYVAAALTFTLHGEGGVSLPRLKAACADSKLMSAGRARALLGYWLHVGFLKPASPRRGKAAALYLPTERFIDAWCGRMRRGLEAAVLLEPALGRVVELMNDPTFAIAYSQIRGETILAGLARARGHDSPFARIFNHRLGGGRALALLLSRDVGEGSFASAPTPWSLSDIVEHCGVSRVQARRLFDDARAEGLVRIEDGQLTWLDEARTYILYATAFEFASMLRSAALALKIYSGLDMAAE
jgi:hypothetical protein